MPLGPDPKPFRRPRRRARVRPWSRPIPPLRAWEPPRAPSGSPLPNVSWKPRFTTCGLWGQLLSLGVASGSVVAGVGLRACSCRVVVRRADALRSVRPLTCRRASGSFSLLAVAHVCEHVFVWVPVFRVCGAGPGRGVAGSRGSSSRDPVLSHLQHRFPVPTALPPAPFASSP